jgi:hypothetical protein
MIDPWFSQEASRYFAFVSLLAFASALTIFAKRGEHRKAVMAAGAALIGVGALLLAAGLVAALAGQPRFVSGPLLMSGLIVTTVCIGGQIDLRRLYAEAELRKISASDL